MAAVYSVLSCISNLKYTHIHAHTHTHTHTHMYTHTHAHVHTHAYTHTHTHTHTLTRTRTHAHVHTHTPRLSYNMSCSKTKPPHLVFPNNLANTVVIIIIHAYPASFLNEDFYSQLSRSTVNTFRNYYALVHTITSL